MQLDPTQPWRKLLQGRTGKLVQSQSQERGCHRLHLFMVSGAVQFGGLLPKTAIKKPGRGLEHQGNGSCFPRAPIHQGRKWTAFFSPGHAVTEPRLDRERFSKRDPWMALGQCCWELSSGPVPHVSASYVSMGMKRDANSHVITVILDRLSLDFKMVPANLLRI